MTSRGESGSHLKLRGVVLRSSARCRVVDEMTRTEKLGREDFQYVCSVDVDAVNNDGRIPVYWTLFWGKRNVAELLLDRDARLGSVKLDKDE